MTWALVRTKLLELRRRRGLMVVTALLTIGLPVIVLGLRLAFHAADPKSYGPAGSPGVFTALVEVMAEFGFIIAAVVGATASTSDLSEGMFRHLVITGRSRLALYFSRLPSASVIVLPLVAVGFAALSFVTAYAGTPQPATVSINGVNIPAHLNEPELVQWAAAHPVQAALATGSVSVSSASASSGGQAVSVRPGRLGKGGLHALYAAYLTLEATQGNPTASDMTKIGLWLELDVFVGLVVGLGVGSVLGQRTLSTVLIIVLQIIITPIFAAHVIPYFLNGQRIVVGVALDQLRPAFLNPPTFIGHRVRGAILGRSGLEIPPMPTWAMVLVIVGWVVGWTGLGAWRMATRDA